MQSLESFYEKQAGLWPLVAENYGKLDFVEQRQVMCAGFPVLLQYNPGRIKSTAAKTDSKSIAARDCFLCREHRPKEQIVMDWNEDFEILVNPYPIFKYHFTIASKIHKHQDDVDFSQMAALSSAFGNYVFFHNGSRSGASAPDHLHFQAIPQTSLAIIDLLNTEPGDLIFSGKGCDIFINNSLPMASIHICCRDYCDIADKWINNLLVKDSVSGVADRSMRNVLMWKNADRLHIVMFPRLNHRPECYYADGDKQILVSPGAIDMAGVLILPRYEDMDKLDFGQILRIYDEVSYDFRSAEVLQNLLIMV